MIAPWSSNNNSTGRAKKASLRLTYSDAKLTEFQLIVMRQFCILWRRYFGSADQNDSAWVEWRLKLTFGIPFNPVSIALIFRNSKKVNIILISLCFCNVLAILLQTVFSVNFAKINFRRFSCKCYRLRFVCASVMSFNSFQRFNCAESVENRRETERREDTSPSNDKANLKFNWAHHPVWRRRPLSGLRCEWWCAMIFAFYHLILQKLNFKLFGHFFLWYAKQPAKLRSSLVPHCIWIER